MACRFQLPGPAYGAAVSSQPSVPSASCAYATTERIGNSARPAKIRDSPTTPSPIASIANAVCQRLVANTWSMTRAMSHTTTREAGVVVSRPEGNGRRDGGPRRSVPGGGQILTGRTSRRQAAAGLGRCLGRSWRRCSRRCSRRYSGSCPGPFRGGSHGGYTHGCPGGYLGGFACQSTSQIPHSSTSDIPHRLPWRTVWMRRHLSWA